MPRIAEPNTEYFTGHYIGNFSELLRGITVGICAIYMRDYVEVMSELRA